MPGILKTHPGIFIGYYSFGIVCFQSEPYVMNTFQLQNNSLTGLEGFIPDLISRLSQDMGFEYEIYIVPDGSYGSLSREGTWNGMIGEVVERKVCPMSYCRTKAVVVFKEKKFSCENSMSTFK